MSYFSRKAFLLFFSLLFALASCTVEKKVDQKLELAKYAWLAGRWNSTSEPAIWEIWESDSSELRGVSVKINGIDSTVLEQMKIKWKDTTFVLYADVPENSTTVEFVLTRREENRMHFQNTEHDFPKEISYQKIGNNSLKTEVKGGQRSLKYLLVKR